MRVRDLIEIGSVLSERHSTDTSIKHLGPTVSGQPAGTMYSRHADKAAVWDAAA